jgi:hypothetical protein
MVTTLNFSPFDQLTRIAQEVKDAAPHLRSLNISITSAARTLPNGVIKPIYTTKLQRMAEKISLLNNIRFAKIADPVWLLQLRRTITQQHWVYSRHISSVVRDANGSSFVAMKSANAPDDADFSLIAPRSIQLDFVGSLPLGEGLYFSGVGPDASEILETAVRAAARFVDADWDSDGYRSTSAK